MDAVWPPEFVIVELALPAGATWRSLWLYRLDNAKRTDICSFIKLRALLENTLIQLMRYEGWISTFTHGSCTLTWLRSALRDKDTDEDEEDEYERSHLGQMKRLNIHFFTCPSDCPLGELSNVRLCATVHVGRMVWSWASGYFCKQNCFCW